MGLGRVLPPLSNSWITFLIWLYIALNRIPNIDCYCAGAVPKVQGLGNIGIMEKKIDTTTMGLYRV